MTALLQETSLLSSDASDSDSWCSSVSTAFYGPSRLVHLCWSISFNVQLEQLRIAALYRCPSNYCFADIHLLDILLEVWAMHTNNDFPRSGHIPFQVAFQTEAL